MSTLAAGIEFADLHFLDRPEIIAAVILHGASGAAVIDPGPSTCLSALGRALKDRGLRVADIRALFLTHIHLDHAGATGSLVRESPAIQVFVHERGAPHMVDPSRLIASAGRLYGANMDRLWGEVAPVPAGNIHSLRGGESLSFGDRHFEVAYTPGHASHHVSYFDRPTGIAFVGDTAGIRRGSGRYVMPPTPPPDVDLEAWSASIQRIEAWQPHTIFVTHFGPYVDVRTHFQELLDRLHQHSALVRRLIESGADEAERADAFKREVRRGLLQHMTQAEADLYENAGPITINWMGLERYWKKRLPELRTGD